MALVSKGLEGVVAAETRLGEVKGAEGILFYCGYDINELAGKVSYEEVVFLLFHQRLPNRAELDQLTTALARRARAAAGRDRFPDGRAEERQAHRRDAHRGLDARLLRHHAP